MVPDFHPQRFRKRRSVALLSARTVGAHADRVTPLVAAIDAMTNELAESPPWRGVWIEFPDTNEGKALSTLARALHSRIERGWVDAVVGIRHGSGPVLRSIS